MGDDPVDLSRCVFRAVGVEAGFEGHQEQDGDGASETKQEAETGG